MTSTSDNPLDRVLVVGMVRVTEAAAVAGILAKFRSH